MHYRPRSAPAGAPPELRRAFGSRAFRAAMLLACAGVTFASLYHQGFEAPWYPLHKVMALSKGYLYQHRVLLPAVGRLIREALPWLSDPGCLMLSQVPPILLLFWLVEKWARLFVGPGLSFIAQPVTALMLVPTLGYWNFYDIGVVMFFTACLLCLFRGQLPAYHLLLVLSMLNHEITLLLIPLFLALYWDSGMPRLHVAGLAALQLALCVAASPSLVFGAPDTISWASEKPGFNLEVPFRSPAKLLRSFGLGILALWYIVAGLGLRHAPEPLRRCTLLLPMVLAVAFLVGQLNESRVFDSMIPVAVGLTLCAIRGQAEAAGPASEASVR